MIIKKKVDYLINQFMKKHERCIIEYYISNAVTNSLISLSTITPSRIIKQTQSKFVLEEITNKLIIPYEEILDCYPGFKLPDDNIKSESIYIVMKSGVVIEFCYMDVTCNKE